jgi:hypothetical protein
LQRHEPSTWRPKDPSHYVFYAKRIRERVEIIAATDNFQQISGEKLWYLSLIAQHQEPRCLRSADRVERVQEVLAHFSGRDVRPVGVWDPNQPPSVLGGSMVASIANHPL